MKERFDKRAPDVLYQVGDSVWIHKNIPALQHGLSRKLMKFWSGPYLLVEPGKWFSPLLRPVIARQTSCVKISVGTL